LAALDEFELEWYYKTEQRIHSLITGGFMKRLLSVLFTVLCVGVGAVYGSPLASTKDLFVKPDLTSTVGTPVALAAAPEYQAELLTLYDMVSAITTNPEWDLSFGRHTQFNGMVAGLLYYASGGANDHGKIGMLSGLIRMLEALKKSGEVPASVVQPAIDLAQYIIDEIENEGT